MNKKPVRIHVVFHAHLDPIWMWHWTSGLDEAMATSRSACDRLDAHPDLFYTQGEAWTFEMVERCEPALFKRIKAHVESGRWEIVNGWWTQPDCNFPTEEGLRRQIEAGLSYVKSRFGLSPRCGFNPDSFGHCAKLPEIMRDLGQDRYVFMRPQEHEMALPARLFRWSSRPRGPAVMTCRIPGCYFNGNNGKVGIGPDHPCVQAMPEGFSNALLFFGVGDHGGGPTEQAIRWIRENRDVVPGARLEFSTVNRFFDAVEKEDLAIPEVAGELQMHAIGCYSIVRSTKSALRRAEHSLARAGASALVPPASPELDAAWKKVAAHQFHDTLGGSSIPEAYRFVEDQLGGAAAEADEALAVAVRRQIASLPDDTLPRFILANPGGTAFSGWHEAVFYVEGEWAGRWRLLDPEGREVKFQKMHGQIGIHPHWGWGMRRALVRTEIQPDGLRVFRVDNSGEPADFTPQVTAAGGTIRSDSGVSVELSARSPVLRLGKDALPVSLQLIEDASDTWSHAIDRYREEPLEEARWEAPALLDGGPLMAAIQQKGHIGGSRLSAEWRVYAGEPWTEFLLDVTWLEYHKILKVVVPLKGEADRLDFTPGMPLTRPNSGREVSVQDWTRCGRLAVVSPDVYALDATPERLRLTLLRSSWMAQDDGCPQFPRSVVSDQGVHRFRFRIHPGPLPAAEELCAQAYGMNCPPLMAELTRGMKARWAAKA